MINSTKGYTLLEVMISLSLFAILTTGLLSSMASLADYNKQTEIRSGAIAVAQQVLDELRQIEETESFPTYGSTGPTNYYEGDKQYNVTLHYCSDTTYCTTLYNRQIDVVVAYQGENVFETTTVFTRLQ